MVALSTENTLLILGMTRDFLNSSFFDLMENKYNIDYVLCPQQSVATQFCLNNSTALDTGLFFCKLKQNNNKNVINNK